VNWYTPLGLLGFYSLFAAALVIIGHRRGEPWSDLRKDVLYAIALAIIGLGVALIAPSL
jgi:hypothetical protein